MKQYIYIGKNDDMYVLNVKRIWEELLLVARALVPFANLANIWALPPSPLASKLCWSLLLPLESLPL